MILAALSWPDAAIRASLIASIALVHRDLNPA